MIRKADFVIYANKERAVIMKEGLVLTKPPLVYQNSDLLSFFVLRGQTINIVYPGHGNVMTPETALELIKVCEGKIKAFFISKYGVK